MQNIQIQYQKSDSSYEELFPVMLGIVPIGGIIMWSGAQNTIPQYWHLCDGTNGTPDLRNRFIVGAGSSYQVGAKGGSQTVELTKAQMPSHTHTFTGNFTTDKETIRITGNGGNSASTSGTPVVAAPVGGNASFRLTSETFGAHSHTITGTGTIGSTGSSQAHENRPPYYALCFIMRIQ